MSNEQKQSDPSGLWSLWLALLLGGMMLGGVGAALGAESAWLGIGLPVLGLILIVCSAVLAVRLKRDGPAGFHEDG